MGENHNEDWYLHLPWVMLSRRVALIPEFGVSSSKLVLGSNPVVPGQLVGDSTPLPMSTKDLKGLVAHLEANADTPGKATSNHDTRRKPEHMPITTETATHVYLKKENPKGLMQGYHGPYKIVERPSHSTIKVKLGTFKSGAENIQLHHWENAKPAKLREDFKEATMPTRGRPPTRSSDLPEAQVQVEQEVEGDGRPPPPADESLLTSEAAKSKTRKQNKQTGPLRRSERLQEKNHATSIASCRVPASPFPERENSNAFAVPESLRPWSSTKAEIEALNNAISRGF